MGARRPQGVHDGRRAHRPRRDGRGRSLADDVPPQALGCSGCLALPAVGLEEGEKVGRLGDHLGRLLPFDESRVFDIYRTQPIRVKRAT
jgi:hypothetical protein